MNTSHVAGRQPLPIELHAATRTEHAALNRTIIARLPLCLPKATATSSLYAQGITVFGQIYYGIEEAWDTLLQDKTLSDSRRDMLTQLNIPKLRRKARLTTSIDALASSSRNKFLSVHLSGLQSTTSNYRDEVKQAILEKPHLLMAYTWTMYLALFNGGRFIAKQLLNAGTLFWNKEDRAAVVDGPLSFWFFGDGEEYNGDDIKVAFKERFDAVSETLSPIERDEVIAESKKLFEVCAEMVDFLDKHARVGEAHQDAHAVLGTVSDPSQLQPSPTGYLASITPSSVASWWRSVVNVLPTSRNALSIALPQEIEQKHG